MTEKPDWSDLCAQLERDGAVCVRQVFDDADMCLADAAFQWMLDHPGPGAEERYCHEPAVFYESTGYAPHEKTIADMLKQTPVVSMAQHFCRSENVWYLGEQLFWKHGGYARRTPWHQDLSYLPFAGNSIIGIWISLGRLPSEACLEFIRGSHKGVLYNGASYLDVEDDTHPLYPDCDMPRLPDVEADRQGWDILSWELERGDLVVFHMGTLHGGGGTKPGLERRSLTLRFFGDDAVWTKPLPQPNPQAFSARRNKAVRESATRPVALKPPVPGEPMHQSGQFIELSEFVGQKV